MGQGAPPDMSTGGPTSCNDPADQQPDGGVCVGSVSGKLVDDKGAPIDSLVVSVCAGTCFYGKTIVDGSFTVGVASHIVVDKFALDVHGQPTYASYYTRLPQLAGTVAAFGQPLFVPTLPASGPTIATDGSAQTLTAGDVTLTIPAGTDVTIPVDDLTSGAVGSQLRALKIADPSKLPFMDAASLPDALYVLAPFETNFAQKVQLSFANTAGLAAGAAVDVYEMAGLLGSLPPAGGFNKVAAAHVSADGKTITMDPGEGVTTLTWIALRKQ